MNLLPLIDPGTATAPVLDPADQERTALSMAESTSCPYCLAAHSYVAERVAQLPAPEIVAALPALAA